MKPDHLSSVRVLSRSLWPLPAVLLAGCGLFQKPPPPPFIAPVVKTESTAFFGNPLAPPTTRPILSAPADQALAVHVHFVALEGVSSAGSPMASAARLITGERFSSPVLPSARISSGARLVELSSAADFTAAVITPSGQRQASLYDPEEAAVFRGGTAAFSATGPSGKHRLELYVYRPESNEPLTDPQPVVLAVVLEEVAPVPTEADSTDASAPPPPVATILSREIAIIDRKVGDQADVVAITLPFQFAQSAGKTIGMVVELSRDPGSPGHMAAISRAIEQGKAAAAAAAARSTVLTTGRGESSTLTASLDDLSDPGRVRAALVYLAGQTGAHLCEDVALVADDGALTHLASLVRTGLQTSMKASASPDLAATGWQIDRITFDDLGQMVAGNKLPPELAGVLVVHTGEAGRHPSAFEEIGRTLLGRRDFESRLAAENLIYLEDNSASSRIRAFDWLFARHLAPVGYDPLGAAKERRLALEAAPATAAPSTAPSTLPARGQP